MKERSNFLRRVLDWVIKIVATLSALFGIMILIWILFEVGRRGAQAMSFNFFTKLPTPPGVPGGGVANAIVGSLAMVALAGFISVPIGLLAGVYLSEFGKDTKFGSSVKFVISVMMGIPSIILGLFIYTLVVIPTKHFSGYAGALALALIMIPIIARTSEDMLTLVPNSLRESALALGAPRWKVIIQILFRSAKAGLITGVILAVARVSGETAPLLFTALNSPYWMRSLNQPTANLTMTIFNYAMSPYRDWQRIAWGASLLIVIVVLALNIFTRFILRESKR